MTPWIRNTAHAHRAPLPAPGGTRSRWLPQVALLTMALAVGLAHAAATRRTFTTTGTAVNPCNGEVLTCEGTSTVVINFTRDQSGGSHTSGSSHSVSTCESATGTRCTLSTNSAVSDQLHAPEDGALVTNLVSYARFICPGPNNDFDARITDHLTVTNNGEPVVLRFDIEPQACREPPRR